MRFRYLSLLALPALIGCSSGPDDLYVAGPVAPPGKPMAQTYLPEIAHESDFLSAAGTNTVFFDTNKAVLTPQARDVLERQANWLMTHPDIAFRIEGHCDERATANYNYELGQRRADAVREFFVDKGITAERISTVSFGEQSPVIDDNGDIQINRRAVTVLAI